ncbi:hypothetical protein BKA93DRAFT_838844 [Sparassis latifolia]
MLSHSSADVPVLSLSDIMHTMSPSPAPQPPLPFDSAHVSLIQVDQSGIFGSHVDPTTQRHLSVDPLEQVELETMRFRVHQLGFTSPHSANANMTPAERELADMVLRLTSDPLLHPSPSQLASQAETIAGLSVQRNFLLREKEEEQARWQAERDGWERTAEALIGRRRAAQDAAEKDYVGVQPWLLIGSEAERHIARLQDDNRALRHKLSESHSRMSTLESELNRLRPLLLVQPALLRDPSLLQLPALFSSNAPPKAKPEPKKGKRKSKKEREKEKQTEENEREAEALALAHALALTNAEEETTAGREVDAGTAIHNVADANATGDDQRDLMQVDTENDAPQLAVEGNALSDASVLPLEGPTSGGKPQDNDVKPDKQGKVKVRKTRKSHAGTSRDHATPLLSDARAECLLVAARRIARMRADAIADLAKEREEQRQREQELEKEERERLAEAADAQRLRTRSSRHGELDWGDDAGPSTHYAYGAMAHASSSSGRDAPASLHPNAASTSETAPIHGRPLQLPSHLHPSIQRSQQPPHLPLHPNSPHTVPQGFVYMHPRFADPVSGGPGTSQGAHGVPLLVPLPPGVWPLPGTPTSGKTNQVRTPARNTGSSQGVTTPMDSLVSAARTMMDDVDESNADEVPRRRNATAAALDAQESPVPKRRRSVTASASGSRMKPRSSRREPQPAELDLGGGRGKAKGKGKGRSGETPTDSGDRAKEPTPRSVPLSATPVRSALDVLAEQAAQEQGRWPSSGPGSRRQSLEPEMRLALSGFTTPRADSVTSVANTPTNNKGKARASENPEQELTSLDPSVDTRHAHSHHDSQNQTKFTTSHNPFVEHDYMVVPGLTPSFRRPPSAPPAPVDDPHVGHIGSIARIAEVLVGQGGSEGRDDTRAIDSPPPERNPRYH